MRAVVYRGREAVAVEDVPEPDCGPEQVKVRVAHNGICGTDLHEYYAGPIFVPTGAAVSGLSAGDRVAVEPVYRCDTCPACLEGHYNICRAIGFHGLSCDGGMAEYTVVPTSCPPR
ncbi:alcohol dehydrogenase catalytic domain-containing protein [Amycolatopsis sp. YIM 10]|uniref:alcohol dehydrogenase catalytic domain-containing protein n=1 Tax=Amycolatopsis sp. YIM 10 TaxID=2653857 RepID=UPI0012AA3231|nr:alcohol dehydrogenase catalytic domain-containing protein [Amycolatopsis sp. YIM 10]QFU92216.1 Sorbitol dehydrogenase [Amycolatopsis sp. YIM 10]